MRVILETRTADWRFLLSAARAASWLIEQPDTQRDAILSYRNDGTFYVRRNRASVSSRQIDDHPDKNDAAL